MEVTGAMVSRLKKELGMSQAQLAVLLGTDRGSVSRWERQPAKVITGPAAKLIEIVAVLYGVDLQAQ